MGDRKVITGLVEGSMPDTSRERISLAYDRDLWRDAGLRFVETMSRHLGHVFDSQGRVLNWKAPDANLKDAKCIASEWLETVDAKLVSEKFGELIQEMLSRGHNLHDPRYVGHQVPAPVPLAGLFDAVGSVTNQVMAIYEMGPWATSVEKAMVSNLGQFIGWKEGDYAGLVTHGGTLANLNGLLVARNVSLANCWENGVYTSNGASPVIVVQADAHYCIARAAGVLGIGTKNVVKVGLDEKRRMNANELDVILRDLKAKGHPIIAVVACACSTPIGAFDRLNDIADVCERHQIWFHVDAAHGGSALLSKRHRSLVSGLERADSFVWDAHKMMFVPALCAFLFFKNKQHSYEAFRQNAPYLFDPSAPGLGEYDLGLRTFECTKRAAVYGLWGVWSLFGPRLFEDLVDVTFDLGKELYSRLMAASDFVPLHEPECNIVTFRHVPSDLGTAAPQRLGEFQRQLRRKVIESGDFYLVATNLDGIDALRVTLINPLTTTQHLDQFLERLRTVGKSLL